MNFWNCSIPAEKGKKVRVQGSKDFALAPLEGNPALCAPCFALCGVVGEESGNYPPREQSSNMGDFARAGTHSVRGRKIPPLGGSQHRVCLDTG